MLVNGLVIGKLTTILAHADLKTERQIKMRETLVVMKYFEIPRQLREEILQFQSYVLEHDLSSSHTELLRGLPQSMQETLGLYVKIKFISRVPLFKGAHSGCKIALAQALASVIALLHETRRTASIKALSYCDLFKLGKESFEPILKKFPAFGAHINSEAERRQGERMAAARGREGVRGMPERTAVELAGLALSGNVPASVLLTPIDGSAPGSTCMVTGKAERDLESSVMSTPMQDDFRRGDRRMSHSSVR
eukprot:gene32691-26078_t